MKAGTRNEERGARSDATVDSENLEPRTSNLEPRTSNLEPRTSNLEPGLLDFGKIFETDANL
jgi:hypothetical protein